MKIKQKIESNLASSGRVVPVCAILSAAFVYYCYFIANRPEKREHFALLEGTSAWPSVGILFFTILLTLHFIVKCNYTLRKNAAELSKLFNLGKALRERMLEPEQGAQRRSGPWQLGWKEVNYVETAAQNTSNNMPTVDMDALWSQYLLRGTFWCRLLRVAPMAILYFISVVIVVLLIGTPGNPPVRGWVPLFPLIGCTVFVFILLLFFIVDATLLHTGFLVQLGRGVTYWPDDTFSGFGYDDKRNGGKYEIELAYFWDIMLIARRTVAVGELIYYPFIILFMLIISRFPAFDNWVWPPATVVALVMHFSVAIYVAWKIPKTASGYRDEVLTQLKRSKRQCLMRETDSQPEAIDTMIEEVQSVHKGAFSYLWEQPAIRGLLLPSSGVGIITLLQYISR